jgi:hypothetical protein
MLVHDGKASIPIAQHCANGRLQFTKQELEQSALAIAVLANEDNPRLAVNDELVRLASHTTEQRFRSWVCE